MDNEGLRWMILQLRQEIDEITQQLEMLHDMVSLFEKELGESAPGQKLPLIEFARDMDAIFREFDI